MTLILILAVLLSFSLTINAVLTDRLREARERAHDATTHASHLYAQHRKDRP